MPYYIREFTLLKIKLKMKPPKELFRGISVKKTGSYRKSYVSYIEEMCIFDSNL